MGIKKLPETIDKKFPDAKTITHIALICEGKRVVCDISTFIYKYKLMAKERWLYTVYKSFLRMFQKYNIQATFIFDGKPSKLKEEERKNRSNAKDNMREQASNLEYDLDVYKEKGKISDLLRETQIKINESRNKKNNEKSLLRKKLKIEKEGKEGKITINVKDIEEKINTLDSRSEGITSEDIKMIKKLFDHLGIRYICATTEAETMCAYLHKIGLADVIISVDSDNLAYGISHLITDIDTSSHNCFVIDEQKLLELMELLLNEFRDFCILCGTDYNDNIKKVGIVNALRYIKKYRSIENLMENEKLDFTPIQKYKEIRDIFNIVEIPKGIDKKGKVYDITKLSLWRGKRKGEFTLFNTDDWKSFRDELEIEYEEDE
jgi:5'-3' exonuclease